MTIVPLLESGSGLRSRHAAGGRRVYKCVTIIKAGLGNARDRNYYPVPTLQRAVEAGRFEGLRAYADHPDSVSEEIQPERTVRDMVGVYTNSKFVREGKGGRVTADLNLFRSAKWLSDTVDDLLDLGQADKIGLSINGRGKTVERRIPLEEAGDGDGEQDVNYVEDFLVLRSSDVVTEAGAGGGFQHLLESARGATRTKETAMLTAKQRKAIKEAVEADDLKGLGALLKECGCSLGQAMSIAKEAAPPKGGKKTAEAKKKPPFPPKKKGEKAEEAPPDDAEDEDVEEAEADEDVDHDAELDDAVDEVTEEADAEDEGDEDGDTDDEGDVEESEDDEPEEGDDVEEDDAPPARQDKGNGNHPLASAAEKIRAAADSKKGATREGKKFKLSSAKTGVNIIGTRRKQGGRARESAAPDNVEQQNRRLREENARLSSQLRVRTTADRARKLLRESAIPEKMRPDILRLMVGKTEGEMQRIMRYHERLISTAIEEATYSDVGDGRVEGAGARVRESYHGGVRDDDFGSLFQEVGIPTRGDE
jgi:hypothetical protein